MVQAKSDLFNEEYQRQASMFKVLSHPARIMILKYLSDAKVCITGDISDHIPLGRTTVNQHLKELKKAGLIQGQIMGKRTNYCLNLTRIQELRKTFSEFLNELDKKITNYG